NIWIGASLVGCGRGSTLPSASRKLRRFFKGKNLSPLGSLYSMAKPTKSSGGSFFFQFMASRHMPSPRWSLGVNSALGFLPTTWKSADMGCLLGGELGGRSLTGFNLN